MEKKFFAVASFEGLGIVSFQTEKKLVVYLVCVTLLLISREDKTKEISFMSSKFVFLYVDS